MEVIMHQLLWSDECWKKGVASVETEVYSLNSMITLEHAHIDCMTRMISSLI